MIGDLATAGVRPRRPSNQLVELRNERANRQYHGDNNAVEEMIERDKFVLLP